MALGFINDHQDLKIDRGYSTFIKFIRKFFALIAVAFIGVVVLWLLYPSIQAHITQLTQTPEPSQQISAPEQPTQATGEVALIKAQYDGVDLENRPYRITADKASRSTINQDIIDMVSPLADMVSADKTWLAAMAKFGHFDQEHTILNLRDQVQLFYDQGIEFSLPSLKIDLKNNRAESTDPVSGHNAQGQIQAAGLKVEQAGERIIFQGPARLRLYKNE